MNHEKKFLLLGVIVAATSGGCIGYRNVTMQRLKELMAFGDILLLKT